MIERTHTFSKASLRKLICNCNTDWDEIAHIAEMTYNVSPHSSGKVPFYLMYECDAFMPTLFKLLLPKHRHIGDKNVKSTKMPYGKYMWWQYLTSR